VAQTRSQGDGNSGRTGSADHGRGTAGQGKGRAEREREREIGWTGLERKVRSSRREVQAVDGPLFQAIQEPDLVCMYVHTLAGTSVARPPRHGPSSSGLEPSHLGVSYR
jgi:hypothetical protein